MASCSVGFWGFLDLETFVVWMPGHRVSSSGVEGSRLSMSSSGFGTSFEAEALHPLS